MSTIRSPRTAGGGAGTIRFIRIALVSGLAALAVAALAAPAGAALAAVGPANPRTAFPDWYQDGSGLKLQLCLDGLPICSAAAGDLTPPNGEGFYWRAQGQLTSGTLNAKLALAQEAAYLNGGEITFDRVRATIVGGAPNTTYSVQHPYGSTTITTDALGIGKSTTDVGCGAAPCDWAAALGGALGPFLHWDPTVAPAPQPGYIGDASTPHRVVGSPVGFNGFAVSGGGVSLSTDLLTVEGKLAGPPVPDMDVAPATSFGTTTQSAPVQRTVTITNLGVPDAAGQSNLMFGPIGVAGPQASAFAIVGNTCSGVAVASGQSCQLTVQLNPVGTGNYTAALNISHNAKNGRTGIALSGVVGGAQVAGASARSRLTIRRLRTTHRLSRARVQGRGLRLTMRLPQGTEILKVSVLRIRRAGAPELVWFAYRHPSKAGLYRLALNSRKLRRRLTAGLYVVNVTPGVSKRQLGRTSSTRIRITRG
ncbi:MAG: hypothetical protein QOH72_2133 [Solirubrobacteraceae bacterium]|nr:hypothetical protein [Solirubrobacteraceae bacterium]